eukprot:CAMPEP_0197608690 /NCGR_PEP_ID=MMETSP1326-20131121/49658_1 /TAXON_ID=1155430 /ORGANISM="Genus nov. species nov., Strain RCC2288" /LENGTH=156 /DNA_ID=CAMNT_0043176945 /DNA_START=1 /DNA_END=467 /DNA_ORIENTATION=-
MASTQTQESQAQTQAQAQAPTQAPTQSQAQTRSRVVEVELVPGGCTRAVTDSNKEEYVRLRLQHGLKRVTGSAAAAAVRQGLNEVVPLNLLRVFTAPELACLLGGTADISVPEWRQNTQYAGGYTRESKQIGWLWRLVARFTPDERTLLLKFATGS